MIAINEVKRNSGVCLLYGLAVLLLSLAFLASDASAAPAVGAGMAPLNVVEAVNSGRPQDVIVLFDDADVEAEAAAMRSAVNAGYDTPDITKDRASKYKIRKQKVFSNISPDEHEILKDYSHLPMAFIRVKTASALARLTEQTDVVKVFEDREYRHFLAQSLPLINQPQAQSLGMIGTGTAVAVLDTGVDYTRSAFGACTGAGTPGDCLGLPAAPAGCKVACVHDFAPSDGQLDDNGHGTNVSGIVVGVAPDTRVIGLDVFSGGSALSSDIINAINWCIANRAAYNIVAINLSLGDGTNYTSPCSGDLFATPISNARSAGILTSIASGNESHTNGMASPACVPAAVSVGAVYDSNVGGITYSTCSDPVTAADMVTCFSNSANFLTLLSPGALITAAGITMAGTSQAAPHIAGSIAVLKGQNAFPLDTPAQTVARMTDTGVPVYDGRSGVTTPRINLLAAASSGGGGGCSYVLSSTSAAVASGGGAGSVGVTSGAGCSWTAVSNAGWIGVTSGNSGSANGTVNYSVSANTGAARIGTVTIAGQTFTVTQSGVPSSITVASPNGGETWVAGAAYTITWNYTGNPGTYVKIELLKGGALNKTIASYVAKGANGAGSKSWTVPATQTPGSDYTIKVTSTANSAYKDTSDSVFTINAPPLPSITVTSPNGGESWKVGTAHTIAWNYTGNPGTYVKIELLKGGVLNKTIASYVAKGTNGAGSKSWTVPTTQTPGSDYAIRITSASNAAYKDTSDNPFSITP